MHIPAHFEEEYQSMYDKTFNVSRLIRSDGSLISDRTPNIPVHKNNIQHYGSITMENMLAGRYSGDLY